MLGDGSLQGHRAGLGVRVLALVPNFPHWLNCRSCPQTEMDSGDPSKQCLTLLTVRDPHRVSACRKGQTTFPFGLCSPSSLNTWWGTGQALMPAASHTQAQEDMVIWLWAKGPSIFQLPSDFQKWPITGAKCLAMLFEIVPRPGFTPLNTELGFLPLNNMGTAREQIHGCRLGGDSENHPLYWLQGPTTRHVLPPCLLSKNYVQLQNPLPQSLINHVWKEWRASSQLRENRFWKTFCC